MVCNVKLLLWFLKITKKIHTVVNDYIVNAFLLCFMVKLGGRGGGGGFIHYDMKLMKYVHLKIATFVHSSSFNLFSIKSAKQKCRYHLIMLISFSKLSDQLFVFKYLLRYISKYICCD